MRRLDGADGAEVDRRSGAALGHDSDRPGGNQERIREDFQQHPNDRRQPWPTHGDGVPQKTVIAIRQLRTDADDLESGVLEQLDERGARVEDEVRAEVLRHPPPLGDEVDQAFRIKGRQQQHTAGLEKILHPGQRIVWIGHVLENVKEDDGIEGRSGVYKVRYGGAINIQPAGTRRTHGCRGPVDTDVFELARGSIAKAAVTYTDLEDARARREVSPERGKASLTGLLPRHSSVQRLLTDLHLRRLRPQNAAHRAPVVVDIEAAEVAALAAVARANHVAGDLIEVPYLVRETDRTATRRTVAIPPIGHPNRPVATDTSPE